MPKLNGSGPDGKGPKTGRGLGRCKNNSPGELLKKLGKGQGKRRRSAQGEGEEQGKGKRLKSGLE